MYRLYDICSSEPSCSKIMILLVKTLNFPNVLYTKMQPVFLPKNVSSFCSEEYLHT